MAKIRMQILLDAAQKRQLEKEANLRNTSMGQLIREAVDAYCLQSEKSDPILQDDDPIWQIVGTAKIRKSDLSEEHDHYIYGTPKTKNRKGGR